jgi:hypothetical protein
MKKRILSLGLMVSAIEAAPVLDSITQPSALACEQPCIRPVLANLPDPEQREKIRQVLVQRPNSAQSGGPRLASGTDGSRASDSATATVMPRLIYE